MTTFIVRAYLRQDRLSVLWPLGQRTEGLTRSAAPSPAFESGVEKRRSGSTLSKPQPSGWGAEGLTFHSIF